MSNYKYFNFKKCQGGDYSLVVIRKKDIYKIMDWRNSQIDVLRQKELLTTGSQLKYFNKVVKPSFSKVNPKQILFSYLYKDECIGYGGFVHISWKEKIAEVSFLVDNKHSNNEALYKRDFTNYLKLLKMIAFENLKFHKIFTETYSFRKSHISILEKIGFKLVRAIKNNALIEGEYFNSLIHEMVSDK
jgi:hypothetical protein